MLRLIYFALVLLLFMAAPCKAFAGATTRSSKSLIFELQKCATPSQVLQNVGRYVNPSIDPTGNVASLALVRLSKQLISLDNEHANDTKDSKNMGLESISDILKEIADSLAEASMQNGEKSSLDSAIEGTKAMAIIARLMPQTVSQDAYQPLLQKWSNMSLQECSSLEEAQISGLYWAYRCFQHVVNSKHPGDTLWIPENLQSAYGKLNLPFQIVPGSFEFEKGLSVEGLVNEVDFQVDTIRTTSNQVVKERRQTAWQGDDGVEPFEYSGKTMPRLPWTPLVQSIRDGLIQETGQYYDGCLLNLYPDGGSAMRYHSDPDQGTLWDYATAVVSVGATRRVAFRDIPDNICFNSVENLNKKPHNFVVMHGDVMEMVQDCQMRFQHTVKPAENKKEQAPRSSLVFKRSLKAKSNGTVKSV